MNLYDCLVHNYILLENEHKELRTYLINNQNIINTISKKGYENVIKNHTYDKRVEELISILKKYV
jgi:spore maturation protein CgeB